MASKHCRACAGRVGWVGLTVGIALVALKLFVGFETGSRAVMADALYSIVDVLSAILVIASIHMSRKGVTADHPYGHGKFEFLAVAAVSICIAAFAAILLHRVVDELAAGDHRQVNPMAAGAAAVSVIACLMVWRYALCAGTRVGSPVILTHAEHNMADAISSMAVLVGIMLSWVGIGVLDPLIAAAEIVHILVISVTLLRRGMRGLLDAAVEPSNGASIAQIAGSVPGVVGVEHVRARNLGSSLWVELEVRVGSKRRMSEAGIIRALIRAEINARIDNVGNIMIDVLPAMVEEPEPAAHPGT